jgi:pimeloyl-ACP methyl ester carboxylesterase
MAATALLTRWMARNSERANPPRGQFIKVDGVRLHYVERGAGKPLVLLHGNGSMIQDFETSGLIDAAAKHYRVIAFDRPGFGYSERPRDRIWTPAAQADLIRAALTRLGVRSATVLGHSWGASVAVALALKYPKAVSALVLASGYYYPTVRADVAFLAAPAIPILGDVLRYTVTPLLARLIWPLVLKRIFGPTPVSESFRRAFPSGMALRPWQLRASAAESALMIPDAFALRDRYRDLQMPVVIVAGSADRLVTTKRQSKRLHRDVPQSTLRLVRKAGHMVHHAAPELVMAAIEEASGRTGAQGRPTPRGERLPFKPKMVASGQLHPAA